MYTTCPKCNYQRLDSDTTPDGQCPACGLIFKKWLQSLVEDPLPSAPRAATQAGSRWQAVLCHPREDINKVGLAAYLLVWLALLVWGIDFIRMDFRSAEIMQSWFHNVDLVFHEAGHVIFSPFGRTLMILGGSLFQVLVPLGLMGAFLISHRDGFAASVCLWWAGQSLMDLAPYIADARALRLPLLGGGTGADSPGMHDWANLLRPRGLLMHDQRIASATDLIGAGLMLVALAWGAYMLTVYYRKLFT